MTAVSLEGTLVRTGEHRVVMGGSWSEAQAPLRMLHAPGTAWPGHLALTVIAAASAWAVGHTGYMIDVAGSAGALTLSTTAVQLLVLGAALLANLLLAAHARYRGLVARDAVRVRQLADAQAQAHRLQLQPHFVFNALQAAATLVHRDAVKADLMLVALGDFLRLTMQTAEAREVPLVTELALLDRYVEVMSYRFGDRVRVTVDADPETLDARVPQLLLQPLVENAIRHGLREDGCRIHVRVARDGDTLRCLVRDDGRGLRPGARTAGIGLRSTRGRLEALYGTRGRFELTDHPDGGVAATVLLPFHTSTEERAA